jgi:predicted Zn-dependent peptidase
MLYKKLANGFQIIYEKPESLLPITSFNVFCNVGNVHSPKEMYGVTHFIEHMCFKGNKENPDFHKVLTMYKDYGLEFNGISTQRYTYYLIKCQDLFVETTLKLMSNELLNSNFDKKNFKKEQKIIMGENGNDNDDPKRLLSNAMNNAMVAMNSTMTTIKSSTNEAYRKLNNKVAPNGYDNNNDNDNIIYSPLNNETKDDEFEL